MAWSGVIPTRSPDRKEVRKQPGKSAPRVRALPTFGRCTRNASPCFFEADAVGGCPRRRRDFRPQRGVNSLVNFMKRFPRITDVARTAWPPFGDSQRVGRFVSPIAILLLLAGCAICPPSDRSVSSAKSERQSPGPSAPIDAKPPGPNTKSPAVGAKVDAGRSAEAARSPGGWQMLFDGKTLNGWKTTEFGGHGEVAVKDALLMIHLG